VDVSWTRASLVVVGFSLYTGYRRASEVYHLDTAMVLVCVAPITTKQNGEQT
jgi:hypothetical protein